MEKLDGTTTLTVRGDLPNVAPSIFDHAPTISVWCVDGRFDRAHAGHECEFVHGVSVAYVDVKESWRSVANANLADHDNRITDPNFGKIRNNPGDTFDPPPKPPFVAEASNPRQRGIRRRE